MCLGKYRIWGKITAISENLCYCATYDINSCTFRREGMAHWILSRPLGKFAVIVVLLRCVCADFYFEFMDN